MINAMRHWGLVLLLSGAGLCYAETRSYENHAVARVAVSSAADLERIRGLGADIWSEHVLNGTVDVMLTPAQHAALDELGLDYTLLIADVQKLIDTERAGVARGWFDDYHPYDDIVTYMDGLAQANPTLAEMIPVGTTIEGRTMWALHIASPNLNAFSPGVVYFGSVHAREWIAATAPQYFATHVLANYGTDPAITDLLDHVEFFLIPVGNPDGYSFTWTDDRMWRKNRRDNGDDKFGVDINRNWGYGWGSDDGSSGYPNSGTYRGPTPFSEPETQALRDLFIAHANVRTMNDIHSYSQLILFPWGFTPEFTPDHAAYTVLGDTMRLLIAAVHGVAYTSGPTYTTIYAVSGDSADWTYGTRRIWSISYELRDTGTYGFLLPASQIIPNNEEILPALLYQAGCDEVRRTQINLLQEPPVDAVAGETTTLRVAITSAVETLNPATATLYYRMYSDEAFAALPLTPIGGAEFEVVLPAANCAATPEFYFSVTGDAGVTTLPVDAPATTYALTVLSGRTIFDEPLDTDPGWATEGLWAWGPPAGLGGVHGEPDPDTGHTGANVYGYNLNGDYTNLMPEYKLTSTPIDCTGRFGLHLSFWRWLGVETPPYDHAALQISNNGVDWVTLWANVDTVTDAEWTLQDFDIASVADDQPAVQLRWTLGPTDSGWAYCGWNIDDIQLYATGCVGIPGDIDGDRVLGATDAAALLDCIGGPDAAVGQRCSTFDFNSDSDADLDDVAAFQAGIGG